MRGFVLDAGAFLALERRDAVMIGIMEEAFVGTAEICIPRTVIAQIWRGGHGRQAATARLLKWAGKKRTGFLIDELTRERAEQIGMAIGQTSHADIVDVHVAVLAGERHHSVVTSAPGDIAKIAPELKIVPV